MSSRASIRTITRTIVAAILACSVYRIIFANDTTCILLTPPVITDQNRIKIPERGASNSLVDEFCQSTPSLVSGEMRPEYIGQWNDIPKPNMYVKVRDIPPVDKRQNPICYRSISGLLVMGLPDHEFNACNLNLPILDMQATAHFWSEATGSPQTIILFNTRYNYIAKIFVPSNEGYVRQSIKTLDIFSADIQRKVIEHLRENILPSSPLHHELNKRLNAL